MEGTGWGGQLPGEGVLEESRGVDGALWEAGAETRG